METGFDLRAPPRRDKRGSRGIIPLAGGPGGRSPLGIPPTTPYPPKAPPHSGQNFGKLSWSGGTNPHFAQATGPSGRALPHSPQNFPFATFPQVHVQPSWGLSLPQAEQNFPPLFSWPQDGQVHPPSAGFGASAEAGAAACGCWAISS